MVKEAERVGRYIGKLCEEIEKFRETGKFPSELAENPERALGVLQSIPIHDLIEATFFTFTLFMVSGKENGDPAVAERFRRNLIVYADQLQALLEVHKQRLLAEAPYEDSSLLRRSLPS